MNFVRHAGPAHQHARAGHAAPDDLPLLEAAMLWAMRAWALGHADPTRADVAGRRLAGLFNSLHAPAGVAALDEFMRALCHGASRTLEVNCVCNDEVSADEHLLLDVLALESAHREADATGLLGRLVDRRWAAIGSDRAGRLMTVVTAAGHAMPRTEDAVRRHGLNGARFVAGPASLN